MMNVALRERSKITHFVLNFGVFMDSCAPLGLEGAEVQVFKWRGVRYFPLPPGQVKPTDPTSEKCI
jgi:uncharacterized protein YigE (DUF2233 family)